MKHIRCIVLGLLIVIACGCRRSPAAFQEESRAQIGSLISLLEGITTLEELASQQYNLKMRFVNLVELMIDIQKYQVKYRVKWEPGEDDLALSDQLRYELHRLARLEGAKMIIEKCQNEALERLESFMSKTKG